MAQRVKDTVLLLAAWEDFHTIIEKVEFTSGDSLIDVNITIINDELIESNETFVIYLTSGAGVKLFPHEQTEVIISDDDGRFGLYSSILKL